MSPASTTSGAYVLRELIRDIPLGEHEDGSKAHITCVDTWNSNLYIGTSAGEVLHYVSIPGETPQSPPQYIFASRLEPVYNTQQEGGERGVKKILLLPNAQKACILCNGTLTFYTLPELSPAFGGKIKQPGCLFVGGVDQMEHNWGGNAAYGTVIVICLKQKLRLIRIGDEARKIRDIELGGVCAIQRSQDLACVADGVGYSLLDVVNQRKNELFPIATFSGTTEEEDVAVTPALQQTLPVVSRTRESSRSFSSPSPIRLGRGHERNVSMGAPPKDTSHLLQPDSNSRWPARNSSRLGESREQSPTKQSPTQPGSAEVSVRNSTDTPREAPPPQVRRLLPPNIATPTANEFLLTTGTSMEEPGVGIFVNLDGDVVRGTIEFSTYPTSLVLDGRRDFAGGDSEEVSGEEGWVLALVKKSVEGKMRIGVESQRWDGEPGEGQTRGWLSIGGVGGGVGNGGGNEGEGQVEDEGEEYGVGLRRASSSVQLTVPEIGAALRLRRLPLAKPTTEGSGSGERDAKRDEEEDTFVSRLTSVEARVLLYHEDKISWVVPNTLLSRLEADLQAAVTHPNNNNNGLAIDVPAVQRVVNSIRGQDASNELDFMTLTYIRQKASLLLFGNLILQTAAGVVAEVRDKLFTEEVLVAGEVDPRIILSLLPELRGEVEEGEGGMWVSQGLRDVVVMIRESCDGGRLVKNAKVGYEGDLLQLVKRFLLAWRKKKGFGSVSDETQVFRSVDAALLHVLLILDRKTARGPAVPGSVRAELNDVVDRGVDCFERAVELFEEEGRLYMLSRLYQSRKMTALVLATWRRILEGEHDAGGELIEGEQDVRKYLAKLRDGELVKEYGGWLASRNPKLGVQVFADEGGRVKFSPEEAVGILKERAPGAVKDYLELLVFGKGMGGYVNDLIAFYLDTVLSELERSASSRELLLQSYETYRAMRAPKPTYRQFISDNAVPEEWWANRLRLLQLIGGSHGAAEKYDGDSLGERLAPYSEELVPEMIILNARRGKHEEALRLLVQGLGDYDTAVRYCLLGGERIFHAGSGVGGDGRAVPSLEEQKRLFGILLHEFLRLEDVSERLERTAELLERFGGWFDVADVLELVPEDWSVELVSGFLVHAFRKLVRERNETVVVKALSGAQNLRRAGEWVEKVEGMRAVVVSAAETEVG
ncbi:hypothetical protein LTR56_004097 [Elasticomyces elasticus]|nr:hypothetical protein LTR56_004097 [Elasticomyces elasticus]KAK3661340.1 hypothetical protein LTR22_007547 [Elasticomyces elasticus]KAK4928965.1 hypothetical protein LTR49_004466 [Elasticomyces elasticus]KAK5765369.1 hypothetical protein LTS12_004382 [Elasticomyces elasticus]